MENQELKDLSQPILSSEPRESRYSFHAEDNSEETPGQMAPTQEDVFFSKSDHNYGFSTAYVVKISIFLDQSKIRPN